MKRGGKGGAATGTGLRFEKGASLRGLLGRHPLYEVRGDEVLHDAVAVALLLEKSKLYSKYLVPNGIDYRQILSWQLLPDQALLVPGRETLFVLELKYQQVQGSVDEKLQTCAFKRSQYARLLAPLSVAVEYCYVLNDWFRKSRYRDVLNYIVETGCRYYFNEVPLVDLGLPLD